jgi:hypothetical protein
MSCIQSVLLWLFKNTCISSRHLFRDRPFNLQRGGEGGGYGFLFCSEFFFSGNTRVRIFFFVEEFNIRIYDKNSESDFFFLHQNQNIFFSNIRNQNIFF